MFSLRDRDSPHESTLVAYTICLLPPLAPPEAVQIAVGTGSHGGVIGQEGGFGLACGMQYLMLNCAWGDQLDPLNVVFALHGMGQLPYLYPITSLYLLHDGQMLLHADILDVLLHAHHGLTTAVQCATTATEHLHYSSTDGATIYFTSLCHTITSYFSFVNHTLITPGGEGLFAATSLFNPME